MTVKSSLCLTLMSLFNGYIDSVCHYYCLIILDFVTVEVSKKASDFKEMLACLLENIATLGSYGL